MLTISILILLVVIVIFLRKPFKEFQKKLSSAQLRFVSICSLILLVVSVIIILRLDNQLSYGGRALIASDNQLPLHIKPDFNHRFGGGFSLQYSYETLIGEGVKYRSSDLIVNKILKYGYNKKEVIAVVNDSLGKEFYVLCARNKEDPEVDDLGIKVISKGSNIVLESYKWVDPNKSYFENIELLRNYLIIILLIILVLLFYSTYSLYNTDRR